MQLNHDLVPRSQVKRVAYLFVAFWAMLLCLFLAFASYQSLVNLAVAHLAKPLPPTVTRLMAAAATATRAATALGVASPLAPSVTPRPTASATPTIAPSATAWPSPTRFYVVPAHPTPLPTPDLPPAAPFPTTCDGPGRMNILLLGIDGANDNYYRAARSDTIMMLGINFADKSADILSIPRDLWVPLPGLGPITQDRINTAYHYGEFFQIPGGGPAEIEAVLTSTFALRVDRFVVVNFDAFIQGIDAIGGVDINLPKPLHDDAYPLRDGTGTIVIDFPAGKVHMDGATALIYARIRHDSSDFTRMRRQQQVLFAARDKLLSPATLPQLPGLAQVLIGATRTDLSLQDLGLLGCLSPQVSSQSIQTWVIDGNMVAATHLSDGAAVLLPNMAAIVPVLQRFNAGK